jgi:ketosteroid isomerase-like protein
MRALATLTTLALLATALPACGPGYLDVDKHVPATDENKQVFEVWKTYHDAIENKDVDAIKGLVSLRYYENGGTTDDQSDDYGYDKLMTQRLPMLRDNIKNVNLKLKLLDINVTGQTATIEYFYDGHALLTEGGVDRSKQYQERSQMKLERESGGWKIIAGL